jgi:FMN-dependent NADH-azoreductase
MPTKILRLDTSVFSEHGSSTRLSDALTKKLEGIYGEVSVVHRDLAREPLPHFSAEVITALQAEGHARTSAQIKLKGLADELIEELFAADILVVAAPMYNFGIPSTLKAWIDYVARAGVTFRYTSNGSEGLVKGKTLYLVTTRGGVHKGQETDGTIPFLQTYFRFLGITDIRTLYAEGLGMAKKEEQFAAALASIDELVAA